MTRSRRPDRTRARPAARSRWGLALQEMILLCVAGTIVAGIGVWIGPAVLRGDPIEDRLGVVREELPEDPEAAVTQRTLRDVVASSRGVLGVWETESGGVDLLLWAEDTLEPGSVEEDELLLLRWSPVLRAVVAITRQRGKSEVDELASDLGVSGDGDEPEPRRRVTASDRAEGFARVREGGSGWERSLVATDVRRVRVERSPEGGGVEEVTVGLVWGSGRVDGEEDAGAFVVRVRAVGVVRPPGG